MSKKRQLKVESEVELQVEEVVGLGALLQEVQDQVVQLQVEEVPWHSWKQSWQTLLIDSQKPTVKIVVH